MIRKFCVCSLIALAPAFAFADKTCHTQLAVWESQIIPGFDEPFDVSTDFNLEASKIQLSQAGYLYVGVTAYSYVDNVSIYISIDENLKSANVRYSRWAKRDYGNASPSEGDVLIKVQPPIQLTATSFDDAVTEVLGSLYACSDVL